MRRFKALLAVLLLFPWLAACLPYQAPPGPEKTAPFLIERPLGAVYFVTADGYQLQVRRWLPEGEPRAVILALHGFNDYSRFIEEAAEAWAAEGIATYAYDQRGFGTAPHRGLWAGTEAYVEDCAAAARLLAQHYPGRPIYLLGESMGGAVAMVALARHPDLPVAGAVFSAPAVWARETMPGYQRMGLFLASYSLPWFPLSARGVGVQASDNVEALRALSQDPLVIKETRVDAVHGLVNLMDEALSVAPQLQAKALLLYGQKDQVVPQDPMLRLWSSLPGETQGRQRPALYQNGWHLLFRDLEAAVVIADVAAWIGDPQAPLPSGADQRAAALLAAGGE